MTRSCGQTTSATASEKRERDPAGVRTAKCQARKQLAHQTSRWEELVRAINRVLRPEEGSG